MITGVQPYRIQELSSHFSDSRFNFVELFGNIGGAPGAPPAGATTKLSAGDMIGAAVVTGDVTNLIGFGTVTQVYDDKFVAFGHPFFADGKSDITGIQSCNAWNCAQAGAINEICLGVWKSHRNNNERPTSGDCRRTRPGTSNDSSEAFLSSC